MSVSNGQTANETTFNNAFGSKTSANTFTGVQGLNNTSDPNSGNAVVNLQRALNELFDAVGMVGEGDANRKVYANHNYIASGDTRKVAIGKLDAALKVLADTLYNAGGGSSIKWYDPGIGAGAGAAPIIDYTVGIEAAVFAYTAAGTEYQTLNGLLKVPSTYVSGRQILLKRGKFFSSINSGNVLFGFASRVLRTDVTTASSSNTHSATHAQQAINASANLLSTMNDVDLTDEDGLIDGAAVQPGDTLLVSCFRDNFNATSNVAGDVRLIMDSFEPVFGT